MIHFTPSQLQEVRDHAERAYPDECCGLLVGAVDADDVVTVTRITPSPNVRIDAGGEGGEDRFEIDPQIRFDLMRALQGSDENIVGHYHSHPDHPAEPSIHDLDMAFEPELVWLIVAVNQGQSTDARTWRLNRDTTTITAVNLVIRENS